MKAPTTRTKLKDVPPKKMKELDTVLGAFFPSVLRTFSASLFASLLSLAAWREMGEVELCVLLTVGIGEDVGGGQYYVISGQKLRKMRERYPEAVGSQWEQKDRKARLKLTDVPLKKMKELDEALGPSYPPGLKLFSDSFYVSLLSLASWRELSEAELCLLLTEGLSDDMGGRQYWIPFGDKKGEIRERHQRVMDLLRAGKSYLEVVAEVGLCESAVRKIHRKYRSGKTAAVQRKYRFSRAAEAPKG